MGSSISANAPSTGGAYDRVLYPGISFHHAHPDRLATHARLFGMTPASIETCRVLEIGCGDSANLIPIAFSLPHSTCIGIDLASRPILQGQAAAAALGLTNLTLRQMDTMEIKPAFGEFDYIIAHGLYSWVPPQVQDKILSVCSRNLAPTGVAYVSYNTYPGGHVREMLRRMMLYHTRDVDDPHERVRSGLKFVEELVKSLKEADVFRQVIQPELERMQGLSPEYLFHDEFSEFYAPVYFHEFVERAGRHGLQYLAEAAFPATCVVQASLMGQRNLAGLGVIEGEQTLDFRVCRFFRATLLCHESLKLDRTLKPEGVRSLYASSPARADSPEPEIPSDKEESFRSATRMLNLKISTNNPLTKAALWFLNSRWPDRVPFDELAASAFELAHWKPEQNSHPSLEEMLLTMYAGEFAELHTHRPALANRVSERPMASPLVRLMLREGNYATNLRHEGVNLDDGLRGLVLLMDGTRDRNALLQETDGVSDDRGAASNKSGKSKEEQLEERLQEICRMALLVA